MMAPRPCITLQLAALLAAVCISLLASGTAAQASASASVVVRTSLSAANPAACSTGTGGVCSTACSAAYLVTASGSTYTLTSIANISTAAGCTCFVGTATINTAGTALTGSFTDGTNFAASSNGTAISVVATQGSVVCTGMYVTLSGAPLGLFPTTVTSSALSVITRTAASPASCAPASCDCARGYNVAILGGFVALSSTLSPSTDSSCAAGSYCPTLTGSITGNGITAQGVTSSGNSWNSSVVGGQIVGISSGCTYTFAMAAGSAFGLSAPQAQAAIATAAIAPSASASVTSSNSTTSSGNSTASSGNSTTSSPSASSASSGSGIEASVIVRTSATPASCVSSFCDSLCGSVYFFSTNSLAGQAALSSVSTNYNAVGTSCNCYTGSAVIASSGTSATGSFYGSATSFAATASGSNIAVTTGTCSYTYRVIRGTVLGVSAPTSSTAGYASANISRTGTVPACASAATLGSCSFNCNSQYSSELVGGVMLLKSTYSTTDCSCTKSIGFGAINAAGTAISGSFPFLSYGSIFSAGVDGANLAVTSIDITGSCGPVSYAITSGSVGANIAAPVTNTVSIVSTFNTTGVSKSDFDTIKCATAGSLCANYNAAVAKVANVLPAAVTSTAAAARRRNLLATSVTSVVNFASASSASTFSASAATSVASAIAASSSLSVLTNGGATLTVATIASSSTTSTIATSTSTTAAVVSNAAAGGAAPSYVTLIVAAVLAGAAALAI